MDKVFFFPPPLAELKPISNFRCFQAPCYGGHLLSVVFNIGNISDLPLIDPKEDIRFHMKQLAYYMARSFSQSSSLKCVIFVSKTVN